MNSMFKYLALAIIVLVGFTSCKKTELEDLMIQKESAAVDHDNKLNGSSDDLLFGDVDSEGGFTSGNAGAFGTDGGGDEGGTDPNVGGNTGGNGGDGGGIIGGDENEDDDDDEGGIIGGDENEEDDDKEGKGKGNGILKGGNTTGGLGSGENTGSGNSAGTTGGGN